MMATNTLFYLLNLQYKNGTCMGSIFCGGTKYIAALIMSWKSLAVRLYSYEKWLEEIFPTLFHCKHLNIQVSY